MNNKKNIFNDSKTNYKNISIPDNIDNYIKNGLEKGKKTKKSKFHKKLPALAACLLLILFITFVRVSPTFAAYLSNVPIIQYFVELINYDKGLKSAVENDFIQHIGESDEHDGIIFTIDDVIIDEERMVIFYSIENKTDDEFFNLYTIDIKDNKDNNIHACTSWGEAGTKDEKHPSKTYGKATVSFNEDTSIPDIFVTKTSLIKSENDDFTKDEKVCNDANLDNDYETEYENIKSDIYENFEVTFTVDKSKFENLKKVYQIDETIEIEGQKIKFENASISPTRISVKVKFDASNTKHIFNFEDLKIVDEKNNEYPSIKGIYASLTDEFHRTLYFESNYFDNPKHLYLKGSSMRALDKDKIEVKVDLENKKLLTSPDDNLILHSIKKGKNIIRLTFLLNTENEIDKGCAYNIFSSTFKDMNGNTYNSNSSGCTTGHEDKNNKFNSMMYIDIPADENYETPIILTIFNYPSRIEGDYKIKIR